MSNGIVVIVASIILILASFTVKISKQEFVPSFQPKNVAFSIWSIIFILCLVTGFKLLGNEFDTVPSVLFSLACFCCSIWLLVQKNKYSVLLLYIGSVLSIMATLFFKDLLTSLGPALLSGWLLIASALGTSIFLYQTIDQEVNKYSMVIPFAFLSIISSISVSMMGNRYSGWILSLPLLWTSIFSKSIENSILFGSPYVIIVSFLIGYHFTCTSPPTQ